MKLNFREWFTNKKSYKKEKSSQRPSSPSDCHAVVGVPATNLIIADPKEDKGSSALENLQSTHHKNEPSVDHANSMDNTVEFGVAFPKQNMETSSVNAATASHTPNTSAVPVLATPLPKVSTSFVASTPVANANDSVITPAPHDVKASAVDPVYLGVRHGTRSNKFSHTIRKFFKKSWWAKGKEGPNGGYGASDSDDSSFSSTSDWGDPYDNPILRKRDYALLVLRETAGKKGFVSFIDVDKQIGFSNRYHRIRRWKNINDRLPGAPTNPTDLQPGELIPEFRRESNHQIFGQKELNYDLTSYVPFQQKDISQLLPKSSPSAFGINAELNDKNSFTHLKCVRSVCSAPVFSTDVEPIESIALFDSNKSAPLGSAIIPVDGTAAIAAASAATDSCSANVSHTRVTHGFHSRFAPIEPATQEGLEGIKMVTMIEDPKSMTKNWTPRFAPRNGTPRQDLADASKLFVSSTSDETKVDSPFFQELASTTFRGNQANSCGSEAVHDDATVVSPYPVVDRPNSPRFFPDDPIPGRISTSRQNDDDDASIISLMTHCDSSPNNHKNLPSYIDGIAAGCEATVNLSASPVAHINTVVEIPQVKPNSFVFDVDIQQNIEAIISSKNKSECLPHVQERRSSVVSSSGFVYDIDLQENIETIVGSDYFEECQPTIADWYNQKFVLPKRRFSESIDTQDVPSSYYPSIQSSLSNKELYEEGSPDYYDAVNDLVPLGKTDRESCSSFETVIHYDLGNAGGESSSAQYNEEFDVSDLKLDGEEQDSPLSNIGADTLPQKGDLGSLFAAAAKIQLYAEDNAGIKSLGCPASREVVISTLLAEDLHCQIGSSNGEPIITVHNEDFECCVPQSADNDDDDNEYDEHSDIAHYGGRINEILTESKGTESIPTQQLVNMPQLQTDADEIGLIKTPNSSPSFNIGGNGVFHESIAVSVDQDVPQLGAYRRPQHFEEKMNYDEFLHFILGIGSGLTFMNSTQEDICYHDTAKEIDSGADSSMSTLERSGGDKDHVHEREESWTISNLTSSFNPDRAPAFVEKLFENQEYESEQRDNDVSNRVIKAQPQYETRNTGKYDEKVNVEASSSKAQELSPSSSSSSSRPPSRPPPPSSIGLGEQQLAPRVRTRKTSVANHSPLERICFVHWPIVKENLVAKILGDYCPLKLRNNIRFNYDSHEFKIHQYYMTTRALLQEQYKTHRKVVFTPKPGKWLNFEWETDILDSIDDFIRINKNLYPMYKGPRIIQRKHLIRRWKNRDRDRLIILEQLLDYWREDPFVIDQLKWEKHLMQPPPINPSLSTCNEPPERPPLKLVVSKIFEKMTMDVAHKKLGRPPRKGSSVVLLKEGPPLGIDYFGYKREKLRDWFNHLLLQL